MQKKSQRLLKTYFDMASDIFTKNTKIIFHSKQANKGKFGRYHFFFNSNRRFTI